MSTGCEFYEDALADLESGRLEGDRARRVEDHLATCEVCRASLAVIEAVRRSPPAVPEGLEARIRAAMREPAATGARGDRSTPRVRSSRAWALPLAAAALLALVWLGPVRQTGVVSGPEPGAETVVTGDYEPYGSWPASDGTVAGDPLLSELSVEELERLLEEMES